MHNFTLRKIYKGETSKEQKTSVSWAQQAMITCSDNTDRMTDWVGGRRLSCRACRLTQAGRSGTERDKGEGDKCRNVQTQSAG